MIAPGAVDMVNFGPRETVPAKFAHRTFHAHNASVTLMRTTPDENASLGAELAALPGDFDYIIAPVGGGGLTSGLIQGLREAASPARVVGAEPLMANDAARSLRAGHIIANEAEAQTIADGARTVSVGQHNWAILENGLAHIVEVPEENIRDGVRSLFGLANLKAEPTGALAIGALITEPERFRDKRVCCVISGGNVDGEVYRRMLAEL